MAAAAMSSAEHFFAATYAEARRKFLAAAEGAGLELHSHRHPLVGADGEELAMDTALLGPRDARAVLVVSSACHGAEGFCGSGVQNALLADAAFHADAARAGIAVLYVHALNPYGFSFLRRTTQENVDLNRNWQDFSAPLPRNAGYDEIAHLLVPATWPPPPEAEAGLAAYARQHGERGLQTAISAGQYHHSQGLFFGGHAPTWSRRTLTHVLADHVARCTRLAWIDLHTGLGPNGHGELIWAGRDDAAAIARAHAWWGPQVTSIYDGSSASAPLTGLMWSVVDLVCPQAEYTGIAVEYGTEPLSEVVDALRGDQWLYNHPEAPAQLRAAIKQRIRNAFYTDTPAWKQRIVEQGVDATRRALAGLAAG
jgi:hypothetical protein